MKLIIFIALCIFSVQGTDLVERLHDIIESNLSVVKEKIWIASYFVEMNATNIPLNVKHQINMVKDVYQNKGIQFEKQLKRLVEAKGDVAAKCVEGKAEEVKSFISPIPPKFDVCVQKAEEFCKGFNTAVDGELDRILGKYNELTNNIVPDCIKKSEGEDKAEQCVISNVDYVKGGALKTIEQLQHHGENKFDEISRSSYDCRIDITTKDGLREKIKSVSSQIEECMKQNS